MEKIKGFMNEILLYSGQYALFYIIMNFSKDGILYFKNTGHTILLFVLVLQTIFLVVFGHKARFRFLGSLIAPLFYTVIEYNFDYKFIFNTAHIFFWIFSILIGIFQSLQIKTVNMTMKKANEYIITLINVVIFLFIYFYFDLTLTLQEKAISNGITFGSYEEKLGILYLQDNINTFLKDPTHIFIIIGGILLSVSIATGRIKILELNEKIKILFGKYIDSSIRDRIINDGTGKAEKMDLCILFSDIRNFTPISETYKPEEITAMLNIYFTQWAETAEEYGGIIDKYIGDAVMIVFQENNMGNVSERGVKCALKMISKLNDIKKHLKANNLPVFEDIGVGVHYGTVIAGDIGSKNRVNYTYIGDSVNIAARLEGVCKELKTNITISDKVYSFLNPRLKGKFEEIQKEILLKGKTNYIKIFYYKE